MRRDGHARGHNLEDPLLLRLHREARLIEGGGDKPVILDDPEKVWVVYSGEVNVFSARAAEARISGPRRHLCRVEPGQALFGMDLSRAPEEMQVLAVGVLDATLLELSRSRLVELANEPEHADQVVSVLDGWVALMSSALGGDPQPKESETLVCGEEIVLNDHATVRAEEGVVWVQHQQGGSRFLGNPDLPTITRDEIFPVVDPAWLEASRKSTLVGLDTESYITRDGSLSGLDVFHAVMLSAIAYNERRLESERRERLRKKADVDRLLARDATRMLASVLETEPSRSTIGGEADDPLLGACQMVGRALEVEIRSPPGRSTSRDPLGDISRASRVRMRRVALKGDWWRKDGGPLLGFKGEHHRPVALLPKGVGAYTIVDAADGTRELLTRQTAAGLAPFGYVFYPPFPNRPLKGWDLLRHGLRGCRGDLITLSLMGVASGLLALLVPIATERAVQVAIPQAEVGLLVALALGLVVAAVSAMLFEIARNFAILRVETKMDASVQAAVWDRLLSLPATFFRDYSAGDLAVRALGINTIYQTITGPTVSSVLSSVFSVFSFGLLFYYSGRLALIATLVMVAILGVTTATSYLQLRYQYRATEILGEVSSLVLQLLGGIAKLRVAGAEVHAFAVWAERFAAQKLMNSRAQSAANALIVFNSASGILASLAIFAAIALLWPERLSTAQFVAFNTAFAQVLFAFSGATGALITILQAAPYYERGKPILRSLPEVDAGKLDPGELSGRIELDHVSFRYSPDGPLVLDDVSLRIEPREFVAIVGPSGAGKSSLFRLLLGFETPEAGSIYYDKNDLAGLDVRSVRRQMGAVLQDGRPMSGSIFGNIVGSLPLTMDDAWEAARMAGLEEDIRAMPMGMFTMLSEDASTISGGQRQRLMIARAIAPKPRILLFDEATSALDNLTQSTVSSSLENLRATRVVIAHRLSTIINADRIYVLQAGRITQSGTFAELMEREGPFREFASRQLA
ncbi:MAG: NHLP bacteriocin export ABC transporter permease/ATPase subunit [Actinomycetota bacterium]|nr:NHLP bacteriocin export ABC transporter permease/ATPase subunit [Actinomycetota bacterium]